MRIRFCYILTLFLSLSLALLAETSSKPVFEFTPTKKIINVEPLGLNSNNSIQVVLDMVPELIGRDGTSLYGNYAVQIDGNDVGESRDIVLLQTRVVEVEAVEIIELPTVSEQSGGQGGVINIRRKQLEEGFHGDVMLDGEVMWEVMPSVMFNYKKGPWSLRTSLTGSYSNVDRNKETDEYFRRHRDHTYDTIKSEYWQQTFKANAGYKQSNDELNLGFMLSYGDEKQHTGSDVDRYVPIRQDTFRIIEGWNHADAHEQRLSIMASMDYTHTFDYGGKINLSVVYSYLWDRQPSHMWTDGNLKESFIGGLGPRKDVNNEDKPHDLTADLRTIQPLWKGENNNIFKLTAGSNFIVSGGKSYSLEQQEKPSVLGNEVFMERDMKYINTYIAPYVQFDLIYGRWAMQAGAKYHFFDRDITSKEQHMNFDDEHDWTFNASLSCRVADHHLLRAVAARNLLRPTNAQKDTVLILNQIQSIYTKGNDNLKSTYTYNVNLHYLFDYNDKGHAVVLDVGGEYIRAEGLIRSKIFIDPDVRVHYLGYYNVGKSDIMQLNTSLYYKYSIFSMAFSANVFGHFSNLNEQQSTMWYYNICFTPILRFDREWSLSGKVLYNSKVIEEGKEQGDYVSLSVRLSKTIKKWNIHVDFDNLFNYTIKDEFVTDNSHGVTEYELYPRTFRIGFGYSF